MADLEMTLINYENYGIYRDLVQNGYIQINTKDINNENLDNHFFNILNIMRDGIEQDSVHNMAINITFCDGESINLSIFDYFFNLIFWKLPLSVNDELTSEFLFFEEDITKSSIKNYIDEKFLNKHRTEYENIQLNNFIDDCIYKFKYIDEFSLYLLNTINNEDTIDLMNENKEFWDCIHCDLSDVPIEDVKNVGMNFTNKAISIIKNSFHCLADSFRSGEGINARQYKEFTISIGSKPDGNGGVYPANINTSFSNGGVNDPESYFIESSVGRIAQILSKMNVGTSGHFARILGLNNENTNIYQDPKYICNTKNFMKVYIPDLKFLDKFKNRYFRFTSDPNSVEYKVSSTPSRDNQNLVGKYLYFRSPCTCASHARGEGICYRCYGDLAYTNNDINIGKIAAEILSSKLTQKLLSAKHLLESLVKKLEWSEGFNEIFEVDYNMIRFQDNFNGKKCKIILEDPSPEDELDDFDYNEYVTNFSIVKPNGDVIDIYTSNADNMYLTKEFSMVLHRKEPNEDNKYIIDYEDIKDFSIFLVHISNNELQGTLDNLKGIINKSTITEAPNMTKDILLQNFIDTIIKGGIGIDSVHAEVIISNQIRSIDNTLRKPQWEYPDEPYKLITLNRALMENPSVTTSMEYQKLGKQLFNPLTFKKTEPSISDLFFMVQPQEYMNIELEESNIKSDKDKEEFVNALSYLSNN